MKLVKLIMLFAVLTGFLACDDGFPDLVPPYGGYLWFAYRNKQTVWKFNPSPWEAVSSYRTPFPEGYVFDMAAGDGRAWVAGGIWSDEFQTYDSRVWEIGTPGSDHFSSWGGFGLGLTYDGDYLWEGNTDIYGKSYFHRVNPDTHEGELMFTFTYPDMYIKGLAWDGECFWAVLSTQEFTDWPPPYPASQDDKALTAEFVRIDPATGERLASVPFNEGLPSGLTWDGEVLWVNELKSNRVYRISPDDGTVLGYHQKDPPDRNPKPYPYGLAWEFPSE
jgi:hypothetical protein